MAYQAGVEGDLKGEQQDVQELVLLVQAPGGVAEHLVGQILYYVGDARLRNGWFGGTLQAQVEQLQELPQRSLENSFIK